MGLKKVPLDALRDFGKKGSSYKKNLFNKKIGRIKEMVQEKSSNHRSLSRINSVLKEEKKYPKKFTRVLLQKNST